MVNIPTEQDAEIICHVVGRDLEYGQAAFYRDKLHKGRVTISETKKPLNNFFSRRAFYLCTLHSLKK